MGFHYASDHDLAGLWGEVTIPANFMLIATLDKHPCMQSGS